MRRYIVFGFALFALITVVQVNAEDQAVPEPLSVSGTSILQFDRIGGVYEGVFLSSILNIRFAQWADASLGAEIALNEPRVKSIGIDVGARYEKVLGAKLRYVARLFPDYDVNEHNGQFVVTHRLSLSPTGRSILDVLWGFDLRLIVDTGSATPEDGPYRSREVFPLLQFAYRQQVTSWMAATVLIGNHEELQVQNKNYWHVAAQVEFRIGSWWSVLADGGIGFTGSLPFAGSVHRRWLGGGVRLEV